jgi:hypothetical protein
MAHLEHVAQLKRKFGTFAWDDHALTGFKENMSNFLFLFLRWQMCHNIIMEPSKDTIEWSVLANAKK